MSEIADPASSPKTIDSLAVDVVTDDVSDTYVSKTLFAVSEFANVIAAGAKVLSGEALLCANLGLGLRLESKVDGVQHTLLFDTGPEGAIFIRNCANLGIRLGEVECIAVSHGHWDHMAALPATIDAIVAEGSKVEIHVNPGMFNERAVKLASGTIVPASLAHGVARLRMSTGPRELLVSAAAAPAKPTARVVMKTAAPARRGSPGAISAAPDR